MSQLNGDALWFLLKQEKETIEQTCASVTLERVKEFLKDASYEKIVYFIRIEVHNGHNKLELCKFQKRHIEYIDDASTKIVTKFLEEKYSLILKSDKFKITSESEDDENYTFFIEWTKF